MRKQFLVVSMMMLAGCLAAGDDPTTDGDDDVEVDSESQAVIDRTSELVFNEWSELAAIEPRVPEVFQGGLEAVVASGVDCTDFEAGGRCLSVDESAAELMVAQQRPVRCKVTCHGNYCSLVCCIDVIYQFCSSDIVFTPGLPPP